MSRMIEASCVAGVVIAGGVPVPSATILSEGVGSSEGVLIIDEDKVIYIAATEADLGSTLDILSSVLSSIASALTLIDAKVLVTTCPAGAGTAGPLPLAVANIAAIQAAKVQVDLLKGMLK